MPSANISTTQTEVRKRPGTGAVLNQGVLPERGRGRGHAVDRQTGLGGLKSNRPDLDTSNSVVKKIACGSAGCFLDDGAQPFGR